MESSRGGPLTTFIMMLPLIVVPTVAMLKPAGNPVGMVTDFLSASSDDEATADKDSVQPGAFTDADEFSDFFDEPEGSTDRTAAVSGSDSPFREEISSGSDAALMGEAMNGFSPDFSDGNRSSDDDFPFPNDSANVFSSEGFGSGRTQSVAESSTARSEAGLSALLNQVQKAGASEVMWFQPGPMSHGFIAFFHNTADGKILRFEGVASSKAAAIKDVLLQIQQRQRR